MYIRRKQSPNSPRQSIQIVEGYRDNNGNVKQRIVRHLGVFTDEVEEAKLVALAEELIAKIKYEREVESGQKHTKTGDFYRLPGAVSVNARRIYNAFNIKRSDIPEIYYK